MELLLLLAIIVLFVHVIKAVYGWYRTLNSRQKKWFWTAFVLLYLFGMML